VVQNVRPERELSTMTPEARAYQAGYDALAARLKLEGFRLTAVDAPHPIQIMGYLPSGEGFYFRGKYTDCSLGIAPTDDEAVDVLDPGDGVWEKEVTRWRDMEAGWLEADDAEAVLRELLADYRASGLG
jgi:hypothetical protein